MPEASDLPPPSPELVALRVFAHSYWLTLKPRERLRFQKAMGVVLTEMEEAPLEIRPPSEHAALRASRSRAVVWIGRVMRELVARDI